MRALTLLAVLGLNAVAADAPVSSSATAVAAAPAAPFKKVLIIILENTDYKEALALPYLAKLAERGALLTDYHAVAHPSQPNYIALVAGATLGVKDDERVDLSSTTRHLGDLLEEKGKSWASYAQGYPGNCDARKHIGRYARKHEPFISFLSVRADAARCGRVKPASAFDQDAAAGALPDYSLFVPDLDDDGHDTGSGHAARWLERVFGPRFDDPEFMKDLLVVVTFDEDGGTKSNRVYTVLLGPGVKPGARSGARYTHYSLLKTVEKAFGLADLHRNDASAVAIDGVWRTE